MNKIPTLFVRDFEHSNGRYVTDQVTPGCEWVIEGEGVPTRKYDGTCVMFDGIEWWTRREVKSGSEPPANYWPIEVDETTGKTVGWEPAQQSGFYKFLEEAIAGEKWGDGTYELVGPKINGNPEHYDMHVLIRHEAADEYVDGPRDYEWLKTWLTDSSYGEAGHEGVVWHHADGRMAKLKRRDFPRV